MKSYLGDSVYIDKNGAGQLVLTTENGGGPTNIIILEPEVFVALVHVGTSLLQNERTTGINGTSTLPE